MLKLIACSALSAFSVAAMAQTIVDDRELYATTYFARFAPQNASDMVAQVPGFTLLDDTRNGNNSSQRGLGQGLGNLLINGKRPSSKDDGATALLQRIPASQVVQIEILNEGSAELSGQSGKIINVVTAEPNSISTAWKTEYHALEGGYDTPKFDASITGKLGSAKFTAGLDWSGDEYPQWGEERVSDTANREYELQDEISNYIVRAKTLSASLAWDTPELEANLSFLLKSEKTSYEQSSERFHIGLDGLVGEFFTAVDYSNINKSLSYEISGDYSRGLGEGELKLIALLRRSATDGVSQFSDLPSAGTYYLHESFSEPEESEVIFRSEYAFEPFEGHQFELAGELVENTLRTKSRFREDVGEGFVDLIVSGSDTEVDEERAEMSLQYSTALTESLSLQASLASEYSKISVSGDEARSESFVRPKGFVSLSWAQSEQLRIRSRLERSVGQLDFYDFASSTNANDGTALGGNAELVPDQTWRAELSLEHQFGLGNSLTLTVFDERIEDFITFVPMAGGGEGKGNIDSLDSRGIDINLTVNTAHFGVPGGKLDLLAELHSDELEDPVTGETRDYRRNGYNPELYRLSFRQDVPQTPWAWGLVVEERRGNITYRRNSILDNDHSGLQAHLFFVEHKNLWGMVAKFELEDLFGFTYEGERTWFVGDRGGEISRREISRRHSPWVARLSLSGTF